MQLRSSMMKWSQRDVKVDMFQPAPRGRPRRLGLGGELRGMAFAWGDYTYPMCVCNLCHGIVAVCLDGASYRYVSSPNLGSPIRLVSKHKCAPALELLLQHVHLICRALILIESLMSIIMMRISLATFIPPYIFAGMLTDKYCEY